MHPGLALAGRAGCSFTASRSLCAPKARRTPRPSRTPTVSTGVRTLPCAAASVPPVLSPFSSPCSLPRRVFPWDGRQQQQDLSSLLPPTARGPSYSGASPPTAHAGLKRRD